MLSMTGFGRASVSREGREFSVEIKTVNHRYLDLSIRVPKTMLFLEDAIRKEIKSRLSRGRVEVYVYYTDLSGQNADINVNKPLLHAYLRCFLEVEAEMELANNITMADMLRLNDIFCPTEHELDEAFVLEMMREALKQAVEKLTEMRNIEGTQMTKDIASRTREIAERLAEIEKRAPEVVCEYREKLSKRITELLDGAVLDEAKLTSEIVFFADRACIAEEITRLNSHLEQMNEYMLSEEPVGRKLDFLVQEMNREANTIGSKANDLRITGFVLDIKSEIEKIREQVQNIE